MSDHYETFTDSSDGCFLLSDAISFAKTYYNITEQDTDIIMHARKSLLPFPVPHTLLFLLLSPWSRGRPLPSGAPARASRGAFLREGVVTRLTPVP